MTSLDAAIRRRAANQIRIEQLHQDLAEAAGVVFDDQPIPRDGLLGPHDKELLEQARLIARLETILSGLAATETDLTDDKAA